MKSRRESTLNARVAFNGVERRSTKNRTQYRVFKKNLASPKTE